MVYILKGNTANGEKIVIAFLTTMIFLIAIIAAPLFFCQKLSYLIVHAMINRHDFSALAANPDNYFAFSTSPILGIMRKVPVCRKGNLDQFPLDQ